MAPPDDLMLQLHAGLEVVKSRQSEINRRLGKLEEAVEALAKADEETAKGPMKWLEWFWQAVMYAVGITLAVTVGRLFGLEVSS